MHKDSGFDIFFQLVRLNTYLSSLLRIECVGVITSIWGDFHGMINRLTKQLHFLVGKFNMPCNFRIRLPGVQSRSRRGFRMFALRNKALALKNYISSFTEVSRPTINA